MLQAVSPSSRILSSVGVGPLKIFPGSVGKSEAPQVLKTLVQRNDEGVRKRGGP